MRRAVSNTNAPVSSGSIQSAGVSSMSSSGDNAVIGGGDVAEARRAERRRKRRVATPQDPTGKAGSSFPQNNRVLLWLLFLFALILVLADLLYFTLALPNGGLKKNLSFQSLGHKVAEVYHNLTIPPHLLDHRPPLADHPDVKNHHVISGQETEDKQPIFDILRQAKIHMETLDATTIHDLPSWSQIINLFGREPVILGLERCQEFRESTDPSIRFFGIAGTFNTGTNLLAELMRKNCQITQRMLKYGNESKGVRWQVPWGKHYPAFRRGMHSTDTDNDVPYTNSLPLVTIREPYEWAQSMCRHQYTIKWGHTDNHCPNLVPTAEDIQEMPRFKGRKYFNVTVRYAKDFIVQHDSLMHFYNDWYHHYLNATYPRILVRFEDLLFHGKEVTAKLCECGGGVPREDHPDGFQHISESAKLGTAAHGNHKTNLLTALIKYGNLDHRLDQMTTDDMQAAKEILDPYIMETFQYHHPH